MVNQGVWQNPGMRHDGISNKPLSRKEGRIPDYTGPVKCPFSGRISQRR